MAQYKSGYKRKKEGDRFLTYVIVGFGGVMAALIIALVLYNALKVSYNYDEYTHLNSFQAVENMPEDEYMVYYYGVSCGYCTQIKERILRFANSNEGGVKMYLMESSQVSGVNSFTDPDTGAPMTGTPTVLTIVNGVVVDMAIGKEAILEILDEVDEGSYAYIN